MVWEVSLREKRLPGAAAIRASSVRPAGLAVPVATPIVFRLCPLRRGRMHRLGGTDLETYVGVACCSAVALAFTTILSGALTLAWVRHRGGRASRKCVPRAREEGGGETLPLQVLSGLERHPMTACGDPRRHSVLWLTLHSAGRRGWP